MFYKILLNPMSVYVIMWSFFTIGNLFGIMWYPKKVDEFYIVLLISFIAASSGYLLIVFIFNDKHINNNKKENILNFLKENTYILKNIYFYLTILASIGVIIVYIKLFSQVSLSFYIGNQASIKVDINRSIVGVHLCSFAYVSLVIGVIITKITNQKKYIYTPLLLIIMFSFSFYGRIPIFIALILGYFVHVIFDFMSTKQKSISRFIIYGIFSMLIAFSFLSHTIESRISEYGGNYDPYKNYVSVETKDFFDSFSLVFASNRAASLTYAYLFNPIATLNYWVSHTNDIEYGRNSFPYFYRIMVKLDLIDIKDNFTGNQESVGEMGLQLPTYLGGFYKDFAFFGVTFFPFLFLFLSSYLYYKLIYYNNLFSIILLPLMLTFIVFSPLIFLFKEILFFDVLLISYFVAKYLDLKYRRFHNAK